MNANSIGKKFTMTCFGESHGRCIGIILDGCPAGLQISEEYIQRELDKRIPHNPEIVSTRREKDRVEILSGTLNGFTTGAPISALVWNKEAIPDEYNLIKDLPRPGHADYPARIKYGNFNDYYGGGRFSGRITVAFVMAGAIAKKLLGTVGVEVLAYTTEIGRVRLRTTPTIEQIRMNTYKTSVRCPDLEKARAMEEAILNAKSRGDSVGGIVECLGLNLPVGIGEPLFDSLDAEIAKILFNVPAVKGVEFGIGFKAAQMKGSKNNDPYAIRDGQIVTLTNNAGGILGGLSSGMPIIVRTAIKPTPSISRKQRTVNLLNLTETNIQIKGRHDPCIVPKAVTVIGSTVAITLADHMLRARVIPRSLRGKEYLEKNPATEK